MKRTIEEYGEAVKEVKRLQIQHDLKQEEARRAFAAYRAAIHAYETGAKAFEIRQAARNAAHG